MSQKRIDIVLKESETDHIIAIEVKIGDWKTALRQANLNKIACDKSYVAMWHKGSKGAIHNGESFKRLGVGLIVIDDAFVPKIEIPAADFNVFNPFAYNYVGAKL
jgi:hypothetical protein